MVNAGAASMEVPTSDHSNQHGRVSPDQGRTSYRGKLPALTLLMLRLWFCGFLGTIVLKAGQKNNHNILLHVS